MIQDGFYLFIYSEIDPLLNMIGHSLRHDHNIAVFKKSENNIDLICNLEIERFSGIKHHNVAFYDQESAKEYLNKLLLPYSLCLNDFVGIFGMPGLVHGPSNLDYTSIYDVKDIAYHSISHLFTSLILDTEKFYNNDIIALAVDGGPDSLVDKDINTKNMFCGAVSRKGKVEFFPISSPGGYWLYMASYFKKPEGTLMALANASQARSLETFEPLPDYYCSKDKKKIIKAINKIIDRVMSYTRQDIGNLYENDDDRFTDVEIKVSMIMKIIQEQSIANITKQLDSILEKYSLSPQDCMVSLSGGYALNCPTNTTIMELYNFKEQLIAPCVNDGGLSIGMGLYYFYKNCDRFHYKLQNTYYGYTDDLYIDSVLSKYHFFIDCVQNGIDKAADDIVSEPIVWIDGRAEIGPRAMGHRSILANPTNLVHKDLLNKYKQREWWRPVAPIILESDLNEWLQYAFPSPYMLNNFVVKEEQKFRIPAVLHLDGSARVQTLRSEDDNNLYCVVSKFKKLTGVPIICNTSLNDKGEPIINNLEQAINFSLRKKIRIIYAYGRRISLKNHDAYEEKTYLKRDNNVFFRSEEEKKSYLDKANPYQLSKLDLLIYLYSPSLRVYDITKKEDASKVKSILTRFKDRNTGPLIFESWAELIKDKSLTSDIPSAGIDLHIHTTASDGADSPYESVKKAYQSGITAIAITDHDTVSGVRDAMAATSEFGIECVQGAEFSAKYTPAMHILGLFIDIDNEKLKSELNRIKKGRMRLMARALKKVNEYGIKLSSMQLKEETGMVSIANLKDYIRQNKLITEQCSIDEELTEIMREWNQLLPTAKEYISLIHSCNGLAILAHPKSLGQNDEELKETLTCLKKWGLDGVEVIHPSHSSKDIQELKSLTEELDLICSGGSDYHGRGGRCVFASTSKSDSNYVPYSYLESMKQKLKDK